MQNPKAKGRLVHFLGNSKVLGHLRVEACLGGGWGPREVYQIQGPHVVGPHTSWLAWGTLS